MTEEISVSLEVAEAKRKLDEITDVLDKAQAEGDAFDASLSTAERSAEREELRREREDPQAGSEDQEITAADIAGSIAPFAPIIASAVAVAAIDAVVLVMERYRVKEIIDLLERAKRLAERAAEAWGFRFPPLPVPSGEGDE